MVFSVKANKNKIIAVLILLVILILGIIFMPSMFNSETAEVMGETPEQRIEFLESFGWEITPEPIEEREVIIPTEFSEVYEKYNTMQKSQGFDIEPYKGIVCMQYIYMVENYPETDKEVHATLLVCEGKIIGGDISCAEADGFMHGFAIDSKAYGE